MGFLKFDCENYTLYKDRFQVYRLKQLINKKKYICRQNIRIKREEGWQLYQTSYCKI